MNVAEGTPGIVAVGEMGVPEGDIGGAVEVRDGVIDGESGRVGRKDGVAMGGGEGVVSAGPARVAPAGAGDEGVPLSEAKGGPQKAPGTAAIMAGAGVPSGECSGSWRMASTICASTRWITELDQGE